MAMIPKQLASTTPSTTAEVTLYTVPGGTSTMVQAIIITNDDSSALTIASIKANGQLIRKSVIIAAGETLEWHGLIVLETTQTLKITVNTANKANITVSGTEVT